MKNKTFVVSHAHAREPLTIKGETLKDALKKEGLNPDIWKPVEPIEKSDPGHNGQDN